MCQIVSLWLELNQEEDEFGLKEAGEQLMHAFQGKYKNFQYFCFALLFQNYQVEDQEVQTQVFKQSMEDVSIFASKLLEGEELGTKDMDILLDIILSVLNVNLKEMRNIVNAVFEEFIERLGQEQIDKIIKAIFEPKFAENQELDDFEIEDDKEKGLNEGLIKSSEKVKEEEGSSQISSSSENSGDEDWKDIEIKEQFL